eukprot:UN31002
MGFSNSKENRVYSIELSDSGIRREFIDNVSLNSESSHESVFLSRQQKFRYTWCDKTFTIFSFVFVG